MPIYEYRCEQCGHQLDALQRFSDDPLRDCPACSQPGLKKKISAAGFRLKGGGWYETDFKSDNQRNLAGDKTDKGSKDEGSKDKSSKEKSTKAEGSDNKSAGKSEGGSKKDNNQSAGTA